MKNEAAVIVIGENCSEEDLETSIENVLNQTVKTAKIIVSTFSAFDSLREKMFKKSLLIKWVISEPGPNFIKDLIRDAAEEADYIFYKTVTNVLWYPRHIDIHLRNYSSHANKPMWSLSHLEYKNAAVTNNAINTIGYRIGNPPKLEDIVLDEISHSSSITANWNDCVLEKDGHPLFFAGKVMEEWKDYPGIISDEISVIVWKDTAAEKTQNIDENLATKIGLPKTTEIKDETVVDGLNINVERSFPTVMGNANINEYNNSIRTQISTYDPCDVKKILLKRTIGLGDVILTEPIIRALRKRYKHAEIVLYTACPQVIPYFESQPDSVVTIDSDKLLQDILADDDATLRFDLDLAYESRDSKAFVDAYFESIGIEPEDRKVRFNDSVTPDPIETEKLCVVCGDGSGWPGKTWGSEKYREAIKFLREQGWTVVETGKEHTNITPEEYHMCKFDVLMGLMSRAQLYVGGDNGPMHIARGFNVPCIILAGAALPYYSNPNREEIFYLQNNASPGLGIKHRTFFSAHENGITFVPNCAEDPSCGLESIKLENFKDAYFKFFSKVESNIDRTPMSFYFNIPGHSYYIDSSKDYIQKEDNTHPDQDKDISEDYASRWEEILEKHAKPWIEMIEKYKPHSNIGTTLLDVGCNIGCTVKAAKDAGFNAFGIDINEASLIKGREIFPDIDISNNGDERSLLIPDSWSVITSDQVLEHIENPIEWLIKLKNGLKDDGMIFIGTPDFRSKEAQKEWGKWGQVGTGEHLWLPTPKSMKFVFDSAGLEFDNLVDPYETGGFIVRAWKK